MVKTLPLIALPTLSFYFKTDISKSRAEELGLFAYTAKIHKPTLGGGHANRGRLIKPIVNKRSNGAVDLIYKDPQLPTAQLVLRQRFSKQGGKTTVRYEDQSGSAINNVTRRRSSDDIQTASLIEDLMFLQIQRLKNIVNNYDKTIFIEEALHRLVEIHYHIGLEEEAKKYAKILGYNYNSSQWFEKSYKVFNKDYKLQKIVKEEKKDGFFNRIIKKIK